MNIIDISYWWDSLNAILALAANCAFFLIYYQIQRSYLVLKKFGLLMMVSAACLGITVLLSAVIGVRDEISLSIYIWRIIILGNSLFTTLGIITAIVGVMLLPCALRKINFKFKTTAS